MNRAWLIRADARLSQLEAWKKAEADLVAPLLSAIAELQARVLALESKPKPGRPPKDKTE